MDNTLKEIQFIAPKNKYAVFYYKIPVSFGSPYVSTVKSSWTIIYINTKWEGCLADCIIYIDTEWKVCLADWITETNYLG
jgi:hypothetical protein